MEKESKISQEQEEVKIIDGKKYHKVFSGYTIRQFFSHHTLEKGPGPGWDTRWEILGKYNIDNPSKLPDEPYYKWKLVEDEE